jgi:ComF family protein
MKYEKRFMPCQPENGIQVDSDLLRTMLNWLLPPRCLLCGLSSGPVCICDGCKLDLPWTGLSCLSCGLPLHLETDTFCGVCLQKPPPFTHTACPLDYQFPADQLVQSLKFKRRLAAGKVLGRLMAQWITTQSHEHPDLLIPVPLHSWRLVRRGFNQAFELCIHLSRALDIPMCVDSLRRGRNTRAQSGLNRKQRRRNVNGAFYWRGHRLPGYHVALVDDVMTTGTTVTECARVLLRNGAKRVDVWVATRAIPTHRQ